MKDSDGIVQCDRQTHLVPDESKSTLRGIQLTRLWNRTIQVVQDPDGYPTCPKCFALDALAWDLPPVDTSDRGPNDL